MQGFRYTCSIVLVLIGSVWITACGKSEHLQRAENPKADTKTILTTYAKHTFGNADIKLKIEDDLNPPAYRLKVEQFRNAWSASSLRTTFTNDVSSFMKRIAEDSRLKKYNGDNQFFAYTETEDIRGVTDTSKAMSIILPTDLDVVWQSMWMDSDKFLKYLHHESRNLNHNVWVNWYRPELKPEFWN